MYKLLICSKTVYLKGYNSDLSMNFVLKLRYEPSKLKLQFVFKDLTYLLLSIVFILSIHPSVTNVYTCNTYILKGNSLKLCMLAHYNIKRIYIFYHMNKKVFKKKCKIYHKRDPAIYTTVVQESKGEHI